MADNRKPPPVDLCLYHWSPTYRRKGIERKGFMPGSKSIDGMWKPPFVCFSDEPVLAWSLSGRMYPEVPSWDLWMVYADDASPYECILDTYVDTGRHYVKEYRVYHRIFKRDIHYIATKAI